MAWLLLKLSFLIITGLPLSDHIELFTWILNHVIFQVHCDIGYVTCAHNPPTQVFLRRPVRHEITFETTKPKNNSSPLEFEQETSNIKRVIIFTHDLVPLSCYMADLHTSLWLWEAILRDWILKKNIPPQLIVLYIRSCQFKLDWVLTWLFYIDCSHLMIQVTTPVFMYHF